LPTWIGVAVAYPARASEEDSCARSRFPIAVLVTALALAVAGSTATAAEAEAPAAQKIVVHLGHYSDDLHAVHMALGLAGSLRKAGADVTLFLDLEGVRLADARVPQDLRWGQGGPMSEGYDAFVAAGGQVLICPHCAHAAGLEAAHLRKGARIASDDEVTQLFLAADKVIDYD
jgi:predicted peroxiredoxin